MKATTGIPARPARFAALLALLFLIGMCPRAAGAEEEQAPAPEPDASPAAPAPPDPEFKKESAKADFSKAKGLFGEGKHKEAESLFKKVKTDAKSKEDKDNVEAWAQASGGMILLEKLKVLLGQGKLQDALRQGEAHAARLARTPAAPAYKQFIDEVSARIYVVIEDFNQPSPEYSEKYGKTFVNDPRLLLDGTTCLRWVNTQDRKPSMLKVRNVPADWRAFEAIDIWVNVTQAPQTPEAVIVCGDAAEAAKKKKKAAGKKKRTAEEVTDFYMIPIRMTATAGKWQRIRLPIAEFRAQGDASLSGIVDFRIQTAGNAAYDFLIEKITLVRKDGQTAAAGGKKAGGKS